LAFVMAVFASEIAWIARCPSGHITVSLVRDMAARTAESLVELILLAPEEEQGKLLAATIARLGHAFLGKSGEIEDGQDTTH